MAEVSLESRGLIDPGLEADGGKFRDLKEDLVVARGFPLPLGLTVRGEGVNFSVYSREKEDFTLILYPPDDVEDSRRIEIKLSSKVNRTGQIWHVLISPYCEGYSYMFKVGSTEQNPWKKNLCIDPISYVLDSPIGADSFNNHAGPYRPRSVVPPKRIWNFDWQGTISPRIPMKDLVIYEMHVRGFTMSPDSGVKNPGTFLGVVERIRYLKQLGVNCVELLPVFEFNETEWNKKSPYSGKKLCQYWGYSTVNFFSPMNRYAVGREPWSATEEFKIMVRELHRNGIEVILDVVFNHTAEFGNGQVLGPGFFHFKGLAVDTYYIRKNNEFHDYTGCGNSVSLNNPIVAEWFHLCIRYWVHEMGVDGFRFDLAAEMTRGTDGEPLASPPAIERITKDPSLRNIKFIAEPWDAAGLYLVGKFPHYGHWGEWNGKFRDCIRRFIKGDKGTIGEFATRVCGSQDLYGAGRKPYHSINFIVAHDGFSLLDLCSYNNKHNADNGENNNDGENHNISWNCGIEGETTEYDVNMLRHRQVKNFMVALMLSAGTPMILMGDEYAHTKSGNNNAWCQDQQKNYFHWTLSKKGEEMRRFVSKLIDFRKRNGFLCRDNFLSKEDIVWHGARPFQPDWNSKYNFIAFTMVDREGHEDIYAAFNAGHHFYGLTLPDRRDGRSWYRVIDTNLKSPADFTSGETNSPMQGGYQMAPYSCIVMKALPCMESDSLKRVKSFRSNFSSFSSLDGLEGHGLGILKQVHSFSKSPRMKESPSMVNLQVPRSYSRFPVANLMSETEKVEALLDKSEGVDFTESSSTGS